VRRVILEALNLSPKERVVLGVLQQQTLAQKISKIALRAELPHTTTSFILRKLEKRKLVARIKTNNHFRWKYKRNLDVIEEESHGSFRSSFLGVVLGMTNITKEFIKILELASAGRLYSIQGSGISKSLLKKIDTKFMYALHHEVKRRKIIIEGVIAESVFRLFEKMSLTQLSSHLDRLTIVYILPDELINFPLDIFMLHDCVWLVDYEAERLVRIEDSALSQAFKSLFQIAEQYGKKIDLNQHIRELIDKKPTTNKVINL
jgi:predicted transcriptional regulator